MKKFLHRNLALLLVGAAFIGCYVAFRIMITYRPPDVVFLPTPHDVVQKMLELAEIKEDDVLYDLGCGDGRIVVAAARKYDVRAYGFDIDPERVDESLRHVEASHLQDKINIKRRDILTLNLSEATIVTMFLLPDLNVRLIPQFKHLRPGSRIVSHLFPMKGIKPRKVVTVRSKDDGQEHKLYLWVTPLENEE